MHFYTAERRKVALQALKLEPFGDHSDYGVGFRVPDTEYGTRAAEQVTRAARMIFEMTSKVRGRRAMSTAVRPAVFEDAESGLLRLVYKEIMIRLRKGVPARIRDQILRKHGFGIRSKSRFVPNQFVVKHKSGRRVGADLLSIANDWAEMEEVAFSAPNFVSEYHRSAKAPIPKINEEQWHLWNRGIYVGQTTGEDVNARGAWRTTLGRPGVVVAVLDDGIDVDHPNLKSRIARHPDPHDANDVCGRDFFIPEDHPEHYNPRPKVFQYPYDRMHGNDIHGTPCAGVVSAAGKTAHVNGIAPRCKILPVKIFHADDLASDARVADAIRYAASVASVISCSWGGPPSPDIELAIQEDAAEARDGRGVPVFCAAGNDGTRGVDFPAAYDHAIAVGASTDQAKLADYSNTGPEISVVAPSSGGVSGIFTTDVSVAHRGFNTGNDEAGGADGLDTNDFGGTSSATPLAAGVAALVLSVNHKLTRKEVQDVLEQTADKIGTGYGRNGHSPRFGYGRVNAAKAVGAV